MTRKGLAPVAIVLIVVGALIVIGVVSFALRGGDGADEPAAVTADQEPAESENGGVQGSGSVPQPRQTATQPVRRAAVDTSDWKVYQDFRGGFTFKYPADFPVTSLPLRVFKKSSWINLLTHILVSDSPHQNLRKFSFEIASAEVKDYAYDRIEQEGEYYYFDPASGVWQHRSLRGQEVLVKDFVPDFYGTTADGHSISVIRSTFGEGVVDETYLIVDTTRGLVFDLTVSDSFGVLNYTPETVPDSLRATFNEFQSFLGIVDAVLKSVTIFKG